MIKHENGRTKIDVSLENETVWLTQKLIAKLFQTTPQIITIHLNIIFQELELQEYTARKDSLQVQKEYARMVEHDLKNSKPSVNPILFS